ncbi:hypothetical protein [Pusillimonas sp.]|uniref:hypothetical protein n=1 Tax=Pusillimonas sp. TaxID=3040095 RepID=UPI0037C61681
MNYLAPTKRRRGQPGRWRALRCRKIAGLLAVVAYCAGAEPANEVDELAADQLSVRELMRLETEQALKRLRAQSDVSGATITGQRFDPSSSSGPSAASLVAIYGVGRKLMAQVMVDGQTLLFMRGRPQAVGPGKTHRMRLVDITERCVEIALGEQRESLCAPAQGIQRN